MDGTRTSDESQRKTSRNIVKDWTTAAGYRAVILFVRNSHHCGYVGVPIGHSLYGKDYRDPAPPPITPKFLDDKPIGKRGIVDLLCYGIAADNQPKIGILFDVHGGITFSGGGKNYPIESDGLWWFGYDCAHYEDQTAYSSGVFRDEEYCRAECESLAAQIAYIESLVKQHASMKGGAQ